MAQLNDALCAMGLLLMVIVMILSSGKVRYSRRFGNHRFEEEFDEQDD